MEKRFIRLVRIAVGIIVLAIWAVIGFVFWIPLLARATAYFSGTVIYSAITEGSADASSRQLEKAIKFYTYGYKMVFDYLLHDKEDMDYKKDRTSTSLDWQDILWRLSRISIESIYAVAFWYITILLLT